MTKNLDLEIRKALNSKIEVEKFMLFTVKVNSEMTIDFRVNKNPNHLTVIATYEQTPQRIEHTYKNVTITYSTWSDDECIEVYTDISVNYETQRTIDKTDQLEPIVKEMIQEIIEAKTQHMKN
jgi:hypothetical protein